MKLSNNAYDTLKWVGLLAVPIITFATAMVNIWHLPYGDEIVASLAALDICIGAIVTIAKVQYEKKKKLEVSEEISEDSEDKIEEEVENIDTVEEQNQEE
jgi:hypothetical protein